MEQTDFTPSKELETKAKFSRNSVRRLDDIIKNTYADVREKIGNLGNRHKVAEYLVEPGLFIGSYMLNTLQRASTGVGPESITGNLIGPHLAIPAAYLMEKMADSAEEKKSAGTGKEIARGVSEGIRYVELGGAYVCYASAAWCAVNFVVGAFAPEFTNSVNNIMNQYFGGLNPSVALTTGLALNFAARKEYN